ncbi:SNAP25 protein [Salix suchowensis]|nr:SNAP25 protein [Salix suchowensis]
MFGFRKSPANNEATKQSSVNPPASSTSNPFDSDDESSAKQTLHYGKRTSSEPMLNLPDNAFDDKDRLKNDFHNKQCYNCLRIAEDIRHDATRTLDMLHAQGEQITRTHNMAFDMDKDLSKGEKLLNSLGGIFSRPWKPKTTRDITGPLITEDKPSKANQYNKGEREKLGLAPKGRSAITTSPPELIDALQKVEVQKAKQDDALSDLSNILGDLKCMAVDMGSELDRQNKALDHLGDDVDELNSRVKGANQRTRHLLGK